MENLCSFPVCERARYGNLDLCQAHHGQRWAGKDLKPLRRRSSPGASAIRDAAGSKLCVGCGTWRSEDQFCVSVKATDGRHSYCKTCMRNKKYVARYGVTYEQVTEFRRLQGGRCGLCGVHESDLRQPLHVDHDHSHCSSTEGCPECVRGLLCRACNAAIGLMEDSPERLIAAAAYIQNFREQNVIAPT